MTVGALIDKLAAYPAYYLVKTADDLDIVHLTSKSDCIFLSDQKPQSIAQFASGLQLDDED